MNEVDKLKGLLSFVEQIANQKGNEWMWDDIYELLDGKSNLSIIDDHPKLKLIYEQNILKVASKHADLFYKDFSIESLIPQLKSDFIKMDYAMRKGDLGLFAIHCYQQVEGITNYIFDNLVNPEWEKWKDTELNLIDNSNSPKASLESFFFPKKDTTNNDKDQSRFKWTAKKKFEVVFYFFVSKGQKAYINTNGVYFFNDVYNLRNWGAHRGTYESEFQKQKVQIANSNPTLFYSKSIQGLHSLVNAFTQK